MWAVMFGHISNVMMTVNSSVNCIIYGLISPQFRKSMSKKAIAWGLCQGGSNLERNNRLRRPSMGLPMRKKGPDVLKRNDCLENIKPTRHTITSSTNGTQLRSVASERRHSSTIDSESVVPPPNLTESDKKSTAAVVVLDQTIIVEDCQTETIFGCQRVTQV